MITFISGAPGTGKTSALVSMLRDLGKDRQVYVSGIPELKIPHLELTQPDNWMNDVPDGSVIVIDEAQNVWRPRGPGQKVPEHVAKLETHRHRGLDFYIISQGPNLIDGNVRALIGRHVHLRELGVLGRWWYEWPECADNCRTAWKNAPIKKRYRLPKAIFKDYKSSSLHVKPVRSFPWMLVVMIAALIGVGVMSWRVYETVTAKSKPGESGKPLTPVMAALKGETPAAQPPQTAGGVRVIDDRVDWVPRISSRPETAPAYDELRKVTTMPRVAAAVVMGRKVKCYTQQGTDAGLSEEECRRWMDQVPFDPYASAQDKQAPKTIAPDAPPSPAADAPGLTLIGDAAPKQSLPAKPPRIGGGPT